MDTALYLLGCLRVCPVSSHVGDRNCLYEAGRAFVASLPAARTSSSFTSRPDPPPCRGRWQRGHGIRASVQLVITTSLSRYRQVARTCPSVRHVQETRD